MTHFDPSYTAMDAQLDARFDQPVRRRPYGTFARSVESRIQQAATRLGMTVEAYEANKEAGLAWCSQCKAWQPNADFSTTTKRGQKVQASTCRRGAVKRTQARRLVVNAATSDYSPVWEDEG